MAKAKAYKTKVKILAVSEKNRSFKGRNGKGERWYYASKKVEKLPKKGEIVEVVFTFHNDKAIALSITPISSDNTDSVQDYKAVINIIAAALSLVPPDKREDVLKAAMA